MDIEKHIRQRLKSHRTKARHIEKAVAMFKEISEDRRTTWFNCESEETHDTADLLASVGYLSYMVNPKVTLDGVMTFQVLYCKADWVIEASNLIYSVLRNDMRTTTTVENSDIELIVP